MAQREMVMTILLFVNDRSNMVIFHLKSKYVHVYKSTFLKNYSLFRKTIRLTIVKKWWDHDPNVYHLSLFKTSNYLILF